MAKRRLGNCQLPRLLREKGWTQVDLSKRTGFSPQQINQWVRNRRIMSAPSMFRIAEALGCHVQDLYATIDNHGE